MPAVSGRPPRPFCVGSAPKASVIREVLSGLSPDREAVVFKYGCGTRGGWPEILHGHPALRRIPYDPCGPSLETARQRLAGSRADVLTGDAIAGETFEADYTLGLSVLEHVYDRRACMQTARRHVSRAGVFCLNSDDGHFRDLLELERRRRRATPLRVWMAHRLFLCNFSARCEDVPKDKMTPYGEILA